MSLTDDPIKADGKAGYSSWCRRDQHTSCATAQAVCSCPCHPTKRPPLALAPPPQEAPTVTNQLACTEPGCTRTFDRAQALGRHRAAAHGIPGKTNADKVGKPKPAGEKPPTPSPAVEDEQDDQWAILVAHDGGTAAAILTTEADAVEMATLLGQLGHQAFTFRLADGSRA